MKPSLAAFVLAGFSLSAGMANAQSLIIRGGKIHTGVAGAPRPEVVIVRGGRIDDVGDEVGKRADFIAFDIDLMSVPEVDIPKGQAVRTIVDGRILYQRQ